MGTYADYVAELKLACRSRGHTLRRIGFSPGKVRLPLYSVTTRVGSRHWPRVAIVAGIHGDETSGPLAILDYLKLAGNVTRARFPVRFLPVANPYGYDKGARRNAENKDLNRGWRGALRGERQLLYSAVSKSVRCFVSLHEDDEAPGLYMHVYGSGAKVEAEYRRVLRAGERKMPVNFRSKIYGMRAHRGFVWNTKDGSFENRMHHEGVPFVIAVEVSDKTAMAKRKSALTAIMSSVISRATTGFSPRDGR